MNDSLLTEFTSYRCPNWTCPACKSTSLAIKKGTFHTEQTAESYKRLSEDDSMDVEDHRYVFSCLLKCERAHCSGVVAVSGTGYLTETPSEAREQGAEPYFELYQATSFIPPIPAFDIPRNCPASVSLPLTRSFALCISTPGAAANLIRITLEELMTVLGYTGTGSLHSKIDRLRTPYQEHRNPLMAIKWLGNAGSHQLDQVSVYDIQDAYKIIEFVLNKIYAGSTESVAQLALRINRAFGRSTGN
ncbi:DUF4145 domain-containing protein [Serratia liquefaciens]|nr:DUF4145 domain-containing protein [Serratia liquefaciens]